MCLGNWKDHGSSTGGYYKCNKYESAKTKGEESKFMADEKKAEKAATELKRYMFYFERFNNHQKSEKIARD
jgi:ariadne-1